MTGDNNDGNGRSDPIPAYILYILIGSSATGGVGIGALFKGTPDATQYAACVDNSRIALKTSAQHGQELNEKQSQINALRELIYERTTGPYTSEEHRRDAAVQTERDQQQDRRIEHIEREVEAVSN